MSQVRPQAGMRHLLSAGQPLLIAPFLAVLTALPHLLQSEASKIVFVEFNDPEAVLTLLSERSYDYKAQKAFLQRCLSQLDCRHFLDQVHHPANVPLRSTCLLLVSTATIHY